MRINGYINNYIPQNKKSENSEGTKRITKQAEQQEAETGIRKETAAASVDEKRAREAQQKFDETRRIYQDLMRQLESANAQAKAQSDALEKQRKCFLIAMRIICGDKVPPEDHKYLAENDPGLYGKALMLRVQKKNPKEYERLSGDEESAGERSGGEIENSDNAGISLPESVGEAAAETSGEAAESSE